MFNLHNIIPRSLVNGPGERFVIFTQGCSRLCEGCINQDALPKEKRMEISVDDLFEEIKQEQNLDGISFSGGEPFEQPDACLALCEKVKRESDLSVLMFTGFTRRELDSIPGADKLLGLIDILVAGPFVEEQKCSPGLLGSRNQEVLLLTDRYSPDDLDYPGEFEIHITPDGGILMTGIGAGSEFREGS